MLPFEIAFIAAGTTIFLNYCIGKPGGEFSPYEIFSAYTVWLSKRRLKRLGLYETYAKQFYFEKEEKNYLLLEKKRDAERVLYNAADPFFTWERAVGMCSICTGFWISLIFAVIFAGSILQFIEIIVISHIAIRLLNKLL